MSANDFSKIFQNLTKVVTSENEVQHTTWTDYVLKIPTKILSSLSDTSLFYSFSYVYNVESILLP